MSGYSEWLGRVQYPAAAVGTYKPVSPVVARDFAINNANHYADVMGQRRVCWTAIGSTFGTSYIDGYSGETGVFARMWQSAPFPIPMLPNGQSYRMRIGVVGAKASAGNVTFGVTLQSPDTVLGSPIATGAGDHAWISSLVTSGTPALLSGTSQGTEAWTTMVALSAPQLAGAMRPVATLDTKGGNPVNANIPLVCIVVWSSVATVSNAARLYGVFADEWPG